MLPVEGDFLPALCRELRRQATFGGGKCQRRQNSKNRDKPEAVEQRRAHQFVLSQIHSFDSQGRPLFPYNLKSHGYNTGVPPISVREFTNDWMQTYLTDKCN